MDDGPSELVIEMRKLRMDVGDPTLVELDRYARKACGCALPQQTLSPVLRGERVPRWETIELFVQACRVAADTRGRAVELAAFDLALWAELAEQSACRPSSNPAAPAVSDAVSVTGSLPRAAPPTGGGVRYIKSNVINGDHAVMTITVTYNNTNQSIEDG